MEGIINIMVTTVFGFGGYEVKDPKMIPLVGDKDSSLSTQYTLCVIFVYVIAIPLILVMLCTKPCIAKFKGGHAVHEENAIEFQALN
jgi:hypothetical protein